VPEVLLERGEEKDLNRLPPDIFQRVMEAISGLKKFRAAARRQIRRRA
jgi:hypothetical protein